MNNPAKDEVREAVPGSAKYFAALRHNSAHHLGCGDIRLTVAQQEEIVAALKDAQRDSERFAILANAMADCVITDAKLGEIDACAFMDESSDWAKAWRLAIDDAAAKTETK